MNTSVTTPTTSSTTRCHGRRRVKSGLPTQRPYPVGRSRHGLRDSCHRGREDTARGDGWTPGPWTKQPSAFRRSRCGDACGCPAGRLRAWLRNGGLSGSYRRGGRIDGCGLRRRCRLCLALPSDPAARAPTCGAVAGTSPRVRHREHAGDRRARHPCRPRAGTVQDGRARGASSRRLDTNPSSRLEQYLTRA